MVAAERERAHQNLVSNHTERHGTLHETVSGQGLSDPLKLTAPGYRAQCGAEERAIHNNTTKAAATHMYDVGDFGKAFDAEKANKGSGRTPRFPKVEGAFRLTLKRLIEKEGDKSGKMFEATFVCKSSTNETVLPGATYTKAYFQGASKVDREKCWRKILPLVLAATGKSALDIAAVADAPNLLGELLAISTGEPEKKVPGIDVNFDVNLTVKLESARPDKATGKVSAEFLDDNGNPQIFATDTWSTAS